MRIHTGFYVYIMQGALGSNNEILRCAAGEALGRIVQVVGESKFIADMAQYSFDRFSTNIDLSLPKLFIAHTFITSHFNGHIEHSVRCRYDGCLFDHF